MTAAVLYVQRDSAGGAITGLRLFHLRGSSDWASPHARKTADDPLATIAAAADWAARQLRATPDGASAQLTVVLDAQGSACQWLAAPSADDAAIRATVRDALATGPDEDGGAPLSWLADAAPGADTSVQGLADIAVAAPAAGRHRLALVSVADLPARVLLDELDKRDVVVRRVCSIWHALALAWDPSAKDAAADDDNDGRVVAATAPVGAAVTIDPAGLLTWSWSQRGTLIAGGTVLLRRAVARIGEEPTDADPRAGLRLAGAADPPPDTRPSVSVIEATRSDAGRLAGDWLGWSVQLGLAPARIAVIGPSSVTCAGLDFDLPEMMGVAALGAGLGRHWPGASVHATIDEDATGRTLQRLTDLENGVGPASAPAAAVDPRLSLTELSGRPGAADRRLHLWAGLALLIAAGAVGVLGWRLGSAVGTLNNQTGAAAAEQAELLKSIASIAPAALKEPEPAIILKSKRIELEKARQEQKDEEPILAELQRVLTVLSNSLVTDVRIKTLQINSVGLMSRFELSVPIEGDQGPTVDDLLKATHSQAPREVKWIGRHVRTGNAERRDWNMAGQFAQTPGNPPKPALPAGATPPANATPTPPASPMLDRGPGAPPSDTPPDDGVPGEPTPTQPNPPAPADPTPPADPGTTPLPSNPVPPQPGQPDPKPAEPRLEPGR